MVLRLFVAANLGCEPLSPHPAHVSLILNNKCLLYSTSFQSLPCQPLLDLHVEVQYSGPAGILIP